MARYNTPHKATRQEKALHSIVFLLAVILLSLLMPRDGGKALNYDYTEGKVWTGEDVVAPEELLVMKPEFPIGSSWSEPNVISPDSFYVPKSEERLARERDSIFHRATRFYSRSKEAEAQSIKGFCDTLRRYDSHQAALAESELRRFYAKGLMDTDLRAEMLADDPNVLITIHEVGKAEDCRVADLSTPAEAYAQMQKYLQAAKYPGRLESLLLPNLLYDEVWSKQECDKQMQALPTKMGYIAKRQIIIRTGDIVDEVRYQALKELERMHPNDGLSPTMERVSEGQTIVRTGDMVDEYVSRRLEALVQSHSADRKSNLEYWMLYAGQTLFIVILLALFYYYFWAFRKAYLYRSSTMALVGILSLFFVGLTYVMVVHELPFYLLPYCILPMVLRIFLDSRTAFMTHLFTILLCSLSMSEPYEFLIMQTIMGMTAVYSMRELTRRSDLVRTVLLVVLSGIGLMVCLDLMRGSFLQPTTHSWWPYLFVSISGVLSLVTYLLLIPIERVFGFTSMVTLVELGDINSPLMRQLSEGAPGTFQHSMQVANLAAAAAYAVGAQSLLVRTGALYHDIGKLKDPDFFTENQSGYNPHGDLTCMESARIIISHVEHGLQLADKYRLPKVIREFISTHHGQGMARYFYVTYQNDHPDEEVDPRPFTYPGPDPFTIEQALLMMADSVEAASRSLSEYTEQSIADLVNKIVDGMTKEGRFRRCPMTLLEIDDVKRVFCEKLKTIYHTRIQYPELKS